MKLPHFFSKIYRKIKAPKPFYFITNFPKEKHVKILKLIEHAKLKDHFFIHNKAIENNRISNNHISLYCNNKSSEEIFWREFHRK